MHSFDGEPKEYNVSVSTNDIEEAVSLVASALYGLVEEALQTHENHEAEECEFESFARDILGVLTSHTELLSDPWGREGKAGDTRGSEFSGYD